MKDIKEDDFTRYLKKVKKEDPASYQGVQDELLKLRLSLKLKKLRERLHKTQTQVAREAGTSQTAVARYESENYVAFELTTLSRLARAVNAELFVDLRPRHKKTA